MVAMRMVVVDVETTGLSPKTDAVVEIAAVWVGRNGRVLRAAQSLVDPGRPVPPEASAIHHLTAAHLRGAPSLYAALLGMGLHESSAIAAHCAHFDVPFLASERAGVPVLAALPRLCTWRCARHVWPEAPDHKNQTLRYWLNLAVEANGPAHRALPDALVTAALLGRLLQERTAEELLGLSNNPALLLAVPRGKYRGRPWSEMDEGYLRWCVDPRRELEADVVHTAGHWLRKRRGVAR